MPHSVPAKLFLSLSLGILTAAAVAEPADAPTKWLEANAPQLRSIDPADEDFSDLEPLRAAIGNSRLVLLGEQSHGDGAVFLAKARLIKFLHQKMGFDVVAFESGLFDCAKAWDYLVAGEDPDTAFRRGVFGIWAGSAQLKPLTDYLGATARSAHPLELAGFDSQFTASASRDFLVQDLETFLAAQGIAPQKLPGWASARESLDAFIKNRTMEVGIEPAKRAELLAMLDSVHARVKALKSDDKTRYNAKFWTQMLVSLRAQARSVFARDPKEAFKATDNNSRDAQMADNLLWLARQQYPNRKIIVWAATMHNMRNPETIMGPENQDIYRGLVNMGHLVWQAMGKETYNIGFVASEGSAGAWRNPPWQLPAVSPASIEGEWAGTSHQLAFVDFRQRKPGDEWLHAPLISGPLGYSPAVADWTKILDGLVYTRVMTPSTASPTSPPPAPVPKK